MKNIMLAKNTPTILIVDDIRANRIALKRLLRNIDAQLVEASSGEEALSQAIQLKNLSLILLDVQMPVMDGYEVAEFLRGEQQTCHIPIIFLTAFNHDEQHELQGYAAGAIDYITKPVRPEILTSKISIFLELWKLRFGLEEEITNRIQLEQKNKFLADHDLLTSLPNRRRLFSDIEKAALRADRNNNEFALLFIDLDGFKTVNDSLGHKVGDAVLKTIAQRFERIVRKVDTVCRFGGDEFVILLCDIEDSSLLTGCLNKILNAANSPIVINNEEIVISASIGICVYPDQIDEPGKLIDYADIAMYKSKESGKNTFHYFSEEMDLEAHRRIRIEKLLRQAINKNELSICYQPVIDIETGNLVGAEALIRWNNDELGPIGPEDFIPIAESSGLIHEIGSWVFEQAIKDVCEFNELVDYTIKIAINASTLQFKSPKWLQVINDTLSNQNIDGENIELEITERLLLEDSVEVREQLFNIHNLGIKLSIDDFGTGYSSLSYLKRFPIQTVKIDKAFIRGVPECKEDMVLIRAIIAMAHGLELTVIAEGVETLEQWDYLKAEGCDFGQGYYFSKPLNKDLFKSHIIKLSKKAC